MQSLPPSPPGTLITIHADVHYSDSAGSAVASNEAYIGIISRVAELLKRPVYLCGQWREGSPANGSGMIVRVLRKHDDGTLETIEGLQLSDGRILSENKIISRDELYTNY